MGFTSILDKSLYNTLSSAVLFMRQKHFLTLTGLQAPGIVLEKKIGQCNLLKRKCIKTEYERFIRDTAPADHVIQLGFQHWLACNCSLLFYLECEVIATTEAILHILESSYALLRSNRYTSFQQFSELTFPGKSLQTYHRLNKS